MVDEAARKIRLDLGNAVPAAAAGAAAPDIGDLTLAYRDDVDRVRYAAAGVAAVNPSDILSVLVWNGFPVDPGHPPTWNTGIGAIFRPYGNLYPYMTNSVNLDLALYEKVAESSLEIAAPVG